MKILKKEKKYKKYKTKYPDRYNGLKLVLRKYK